MICIQGGTALLGEAKLELCHYQPDEDDYIPVACSVHPDTVTGDLLFLVVRMLPQATVLLFTNGIS